MRASVLQLVLLSDIAVLAQSVKISDRLGEARYTSLNKVHEDVKTRLRIPKAEAAGYRVFQQEAIPFADPRKDEVAAHNIPLFATTGVSPSASYIRLLLKDEKGNGTLALRNVQDAAHVAPIEIGGQSFLGLLDTGSSDTWVAGSNFNCKRSRKPCKFPATYTKTNRREVVTFGGITIPNAKIGIVHEGEFSVDEASSGIIGLAFPGDTRAYALETNVYGDENAQSIPYAPLFTIMYQQGLLAPDFSVAMQRRNETNGVLALGGLPGLPIKYDSNFTTARFEYLIFDDGSYTRPGNKIKEYSLYMIKTTGFHIQKNSSKLAVNTIFDTGSPINYVPPQIAEDVARGFVPPAIRDQQTWQFVVDCNAVPPSFGVNINGTTLIVDPEDMVLKGATRMGDAGALPVVTGKNKCLSAVQESNIFSLGVHITGSAVYEKCGYSF
ncbi:acid protease [Tothia fuscella]|uniref:Acid protease n=1 Tax=Tothia fuscella TaxID=1048955 RepID=A0A9P4U277_9PEZI|nr:acid protease [Tothia fuscella]